MRLKYNCKQQNVRLWVYSNALGTFYQLCTWMSGGWSISHSILEHAQSTLKRHKHESIPQIHGQTTTGWENSSVEKDWGSKIKMTPELVEMHTVFSLCYQI